ncbi:hypothetical protein Q9189_006510 [Teloschistes chrysophthalmus]
MATMKTPILPLLSAIIFVSFSLSSSLISRPFPRTPFELLVANGSITTLEYATAHHLAKTQQQSSDTSHSDIPKHHLPSLSTIEAIDYPVPNTAILLRLALSPSNPIDRPALGRTILTAQRSLRRHILDNGDDYLDDSDDPYEVDDRRTGKCMIGMKSAKKHTTGDERLRYGRVLDTFQGLWEVLYLGRRCWVGIFQVEDGGEVVGTGKVLVGNVGLVSWA